MSNLPVFNSPPSIGWNSTKTQRWDTQIQKYGSGRRKTLSRWSYPEWELNCSYTCLNQTELEYVAGFFAKMRGQAGTFLWKDPEDYRQTGVQIGIGNGTTDKFQLVRNYGGFVEPVWDVVPGTLKLYQDGEILEDTVNLLNNPSFETGDLSSWSNWNAPTTKEVVSVDGSYALHLVTSDDNQGVSQAVTLVSGETYTLSARVKVISGRCVVMIHTGTQYLSKSTATSWTGDGNWHRLALTFIAGSNNTIYIGISAEGVIGEYYFDDVQVEKKPYSTPPTTGIRTITNTDGLISFGSAPRKGAIITADFDYYWRVAFDSDEAVWENFWYNFYRMRNVKLVTVK